MLKNYLVLLVIAMSGFALTDAEENDTFGANMSYVSTDKVSIMKPIGKV